MIIEATNISKYILITKKVIYCTYANRTNRNKRATENLFVF